MKRDKIYISTISCDAGQVAKEYGLGLEISEYCTAWNIDEKFLNTNNIVKKKLKNVHHSMFHAPYNELFPCAIDKKARELAAYRYRQAIKLAKSYNSKKVIIHGGFNPLIYFPNWYIEQSILFWKEFLLQNTGIPIVLENVLEDNPSLLLEIIKGVNNPNLRLCLDIGHVNAYSKISIMDWLKSLAPFISHFHIHNNDGSYDKHDSLTEGTIPIKQFLTFADRLCPDATYTLELTGSSRPSVKWLASQDYFEDIR